MALEKDLWVEHIRFCEAGGPARHENPSNVAESTLDVEVVEHGRADHRVEYLVIRQRFERDTPESHSLGRRVASARTRKQHVRQVDREEICSRRSKRLGEQAGPTADFENALSGCDAGSSDDKRRAPSRPPPACRAVPPPDQLGIVVSKLSTMLDFTRGSLEAQDRYSRERTIRANIAAAGTRRSMARSTPRQTSYDQPGISDRIDIPPERQ